MKKLFILASFFAVFLLIAGCQSETPVDPVNGQETTLEKFSVTVVDHPVHSHAFLVQWGSAGGRAKKYWIYALLNGISVSSTYCNSIKGAHEYNATFSNTYPSGSPLVIGETYTFRVEARDGDGHVIKYVTSGEFTLP